MVGTESGQREASFSFVWMKSLLYIYGLHTGLPVEWWRAGIFGFGGKAVCTQLPIEPQT